MRNKRQQRRRADTMRADLAQRYEALVELAFHAMARLHENADPEALHDLRVSLRSQRVLLAAFRDRASVSEARGRLAEAAGLSNAVRDLEVSLEWADGLYTETGEGAAACEALRARLDTARQGLLAGLQHARLDEALVDAELAWFRALNRSRRKPLRKRLRGRAGRLAARMRKMARALTADVAPAAWHPLRLEGKRLRYWIEGFSDTLPRRQRRLVKPLRFLQLSLGSLQDLSVLRANLAELPGEVPPSWSTAIAREEGKCAAEAARVLDELMPLLARARQR
ncbi:CHAD domain-containing protein [Crenobacter luteus]|uniref:CHAD domain-containing protein n=1 Tax=Crenobacter luteus TaxID=1452487 RepID=UPI0010F3ECD4|nr:CHAD domain-containing protein [Crenobacter luteus]TCP08452.1 CHAD domain-containing protein [Crenobacter luteus]